MAGWAAIRHLADQRRREVTGTEPTLERADRIVQSALGHAGLWVTGTSPGDPALAGALALLDREAQGIIYNADLPPETIAFNLAHELAHWWLHDESEGCGTEDIVADPIAEPLPYGESYVSGYSPVQKRETEANIFAAAFLLPAPLLRDCFGQGMMPDRIASEAGLSEGMVLAQLADALLLDVAESPLLLPPAEVTLVFDLDPSQRAAAEVNQGPVLVVAGPGTGKTRTLVGRILFLLQNGTPPERILALTFSNKAANEMRERLAAVAGDPARRLWIGTFHAFGLELLRRFGDRLGLPPRPALLDPLDAIALLERHFADLNLRALEYLHNPSYPFRDILSAISRAKDELITPEQFDALVRQMHSQPGDEKAERAAARLREVAGVYAKWRAILQMEGKLDFGDLIMRAVELLRNHPNVKEQVRAEYPQILVDEYQDINRASALLVKEVAGEGKGIWAVGDLRQAIYGFRGAAPANVTQFAQDFPGARELTLDINYRSRSPIVKMFGHAADSMSTPGASPSEWESMRGPQEDAVVYAEAENESAQAAGIADSIRDFQASGIPLRDQAVLCRTNTQAEKMAALLEERGVPVVYLGDLFSRPEARDMLALLSLACEGHGQGLLRVAQKPEYAATLDEVTAVLDRAKSLGIPFPRALAGCGVSAFEELHAHLDPLAYRGNAFAFFTHYLFGPARYLRDLMVDETIHARQSRLAIHQLLLLAREHAQRLSPGEENPQRAFLDHVRRLLAAQEGSRMRVQADAEGIEGVRLLTVHASKGLEFPVVFLPNLAKYLFPSRARAGMIQLPEEIGAASRSAEADEDTRLFFVALSRARDYLVLSRPLNVKGKPREPSQLLNLIAESLQSGGVKRLEWKDKGRRDSDTSAAPLSPPRERVDVSLPEVEQYMRCPRQYYYDRVLRLPKPEYKGLYRSMQLCLREVARWLRSELAAGRSIPPGEMDAKIDEIWNVLAPADHIHGDLFHMRARDMANRIYAVTSSEPAQGHAISGTQELAADFPAGRIRIKLDHAAETPEGGLHIERYDGGRPSDGDQTKPRLALIRQAAKRSPGGESVRIKLRYLSTGETRDVPEQPRWEPARVAQYEKALEGIRDEDFAPNPSPDNCPGCPFFFICPR